MWEGGEWLETSLPPKSWGGLKQCPAVLGLAPAPVETHGPAVTISQEQEDRRNCDTGASAPRVVQQTHCSLLCMSRSSPKHHQTRTEDAPGTAVSHHTHTGRPLPLTWNMAWFSLFCSSCVQTWFCSNREFPSNAFWGRKQSKKEQKDRSLNRPGGERSRC